MRYVYLLRNAEGEIVYIGQAGNVAQRLRTHYHAATKGAHREIRRRTLEWLPSVRDVEVRGPFHPCDIHAVERGLIEQYQPRGNRMFTIAHGWTPRRAS